MGRDSLSHRCTTSPAGKAGNALLCSIHRSQDRTAEAMAAAQLEALAVQLQLPNQSGRGCRCHYTEAQVEAAMAVQALETEM